MILLSSKMQIILAIINQKAFTIYGSVGSRKVGSRKEDPTGSIGLTWVLGEKL